MATPTLTQFTPAASCAVNSGLWAITKSCYLYPNSGPSTVLVNPPWMTCTAVQMGEPTEARNPDCHSGWGTIKTDGPFFTACPVGYSVAGSETYWPYISTSVSPETTVDVSDEGVKVSMMMCCPSASGYEFRLDQPDDFRINTVHEGITYSGFTYVMPRCRAMARTAQTVTLTPFSNTWGGERRRQETTAGPLITEVFSPGKKVYAAAETFIQTVFADGHTCYGNCEAYYQSHYTSPTGPRTSTTSTSQSSVPTATGTSGAQGAPPTSGASSADIMRGWAILGGLFLAFTVAVTAV
ncbi:hypothetical protein QBC34DRAFT_212208 [Podospora aff. communis PSN243]|uniref:Uncharacterized protein n=1 Tax=Podospora aff. communis PSN243 TaxID=3040156 RepID=A0AAV9G5B9_9PEZI|nr:hypothetical protein QBC34DRAFT_212208 [Podospora aff. communis PSN243]